VAEIVMEFSSSDDAIDGNLSRLRWIPHSALLILQRDFNMASYCLTPITNLKGGSISTPIETVSVLLLPFLALYSPSAFV
jgi:hypothetical protein